MTEIKIEIDETLYDLVKQIGKKQKMTAEELISKIVTDYIGEKIDEVRSS